MELTWGAYIRFISRSRVCNGPSCGRFLLNASKRNAVQGWTMLDSIKTSTIYNWEQIHDQLNKQESSVISSQFLLANFIQL